MAIASENSLTIIVRTWIFMLIFCFAGCAAGSCLSYGHSCWGAHGKRSGGHGNTNGYLVPTRTMTNDVQQDAPSYTKDQWILSRLIAGRPLVSLPNKYRARWNSLHKMKALVPQHWEKDENNVRISDEDIRDYNNNNNNDEDNNRNINGIEDIVSSVNNDHKEIPDILLMTHDDNQELETKPRNVQLFKLLNNVNDNFE